MDSACGVAVLTASVASVRTRAMAQLRAVRWSVGEDTEAKAGDVSTHGGGPRPDTRVGCVATRCRGEAKTDPMPHSSQMAGQQRAYLDDAAKVSKDSTAAVARALKSAEAAREVASSTLSELALQTDALVRRPSPARCHAARLMHVFCGQRHVAQSLGEAEESMGQAEKTLDTINTRCFGCFGPKRRLSRRTSSEGAPGEEFRGAGVKAQARAIGNQGAHRASASTAPPLFHDETLAADAAQQDDMLRQLDAAVGQLHTVAQTINAEVHDQQPSLDRLSERAHDLKNRMTAANTHGKLAYIDKPKRGFWKRQ